MSDMAFLVGCLVLGLCIITAATIVGVSIQDYAKIVKTVEVNVRWNPTVDLVDRRGSP